MLDVCAIGSGSRGNAYWIRAEGSAVLVDCGIPATRLLRALDRIGASPGELEGIVVTHEHTDHTAGLAVLRKRHDLPVWATPGTWEGIRRPGPGPFRPLDPGRPFAIGPFRILPFPTPHDAAEPIGVVLESDAGSVAVATDLGRVDDAVLERIGGARVLILESNHDEDLLRDGSYPWFLKERIRGDFGHLSNRASGNALVAAAHDGLEAVILAHLSKENNRPALAMKGACDALRRCGRSGVKVIVAEQEREGEVLNFR
ncbi:MAG: MBL fold metallo-hydrolase [Candidatus Eisenbacteria bacterium]|nr:MBL fold metallo-hydrolase [Candidatus Eisenbacteria bacterium]